jgi:hypothetical protein
MATQLPVTANTWALWRFNELAGSTLIADAASHAINLALDPNGGVNETAGVASFLTRARRFAALGCYSQSLIGTIVPGTAGDLAMWQAEWTIEALFTPSGAQGIGTYAGILSYGGPTLLAAQNIQALLLVKRNGANNNTISIAWANGAGNLILTDSTANFDDTRHLLTIVKRLPGATASLDFYVDGVFKQTVNAIAVATGGTGAGWAIGANFPSDGAPNPATPNLFGDLDEMRISNFAMTGAQALADWNFINSSPITGVGVGGGSGGGGSGTKLQPGATSILAGAAGQMLFKTETDHAYDSVSFGSAQVIAANGKLGPVIGAGNAFILRTLVPVKKRRARRLSVQYQHNAAFEYLAISGVSFVWNEYTDGEKTSDT